MADSELDKMDTVPSRVAETGGQMRMGGGEEGGSRIDANLAVLWLSKKAELGRGVPVLVQRAAGTDIDRGIF